MPGGGTAKRKGDESVKRRPKKVRKDEVDETTKKTTPHQNKDTDLDDGVGINFAEGFDHVKNEAANEFDQYSSLIRSKLADLEDEDDQTSTANKKIVISPDRFDPSNHLLLDIRELL